MMCERRPARFARVSTSRGGEPPKATGGRSHALLYSDAAHAIVYCVLGIALPRWQVTHCTRIPFGADVDFPRSASSLELMSVTNLIITRAVFFACLSSEAASIGI